MLLRFLSTIVLAPLAIAAIWFGWPYFDVVIAIVGVLAIAEWFRVSQSAAADRMAGANRLIWPAIGVLYIGIACLSMAGLRGDAAQGRGLALAFFAVVWATDIGAYLVGRTLGGPKLAPSISPNKTWSGAVGGLVCGVVCGVAVARFMDLSYANAALVVIGGVISVISQIGDLLESWWKRYFGVKDSGHLIPGHGGILDRIDGVLLASPFAMVGHWVAQGGGLLWK